MSKWLTFGKPGKSKSGKTQEWGVTSGKDGAIVYVGTVKWMGRWRCYAFFPEPEMVFEKTCMRDLAAFCEQQTKAHASRR